MKRFFATVAVVSIVAAGAPAMAPPYGNGPDHGRNDNAAQHRNWGKDYGPDHRYRRGQRMGYNDWQGSNRVDYRQHHLRQPPRGYEWRERNGQYVLAAIATGLIASIILNGGH